MMKKPSLCRRLFARYPKGLSSCRGLARYSKGLSSCRRLANYSQRLVVLPRSCALFPTACRPAAALRAIPNGLLFCRGLARYPIGVMLFREAFERAAGEEAIVILISSKISGTLNAARIAKEEGGFDNVLLYDSLCTTAMQRILVEEAVRRRDRSVREAAEILDGLRPRLRLFAALDTLDTLEYLYKGGRIKGGTALMGKLLGIKPVVELTVEGEVKNVGRAHGRKKALAEVKRLSEREKRDPAFSPYYLYCKTEAVCDELTELTGERSARRFNICCAVGAHIGPNAAGVVYVVAQE